MGKNSYSITKGYYTLRFFEKDKYVEEFRNGKIRMMSAEYYANLEKALCFELYNNRFDITEGKSLLINHPNDNTLKKYGITVNRRLDRLIYNDGQLNKKLKISCYMAINIKDMPSGKFSEALLNMEDSLGDYYCIILELEEFINRVINAVKKLSDKIELRAGLVKYNINVNTFSGWIDPFEKPQGLSWQKEYRLQLSPIDLDDPFYLDIGNIRDITIWGHKDDLQKGYFASEGELKIANHKQ